VLSQSSDERLEVQAYEYLPITADADLIVNLRRQLEALNKIEFSDAEWERFFGICIAGANDSSSYSGPSSGSRTSSRHSTTSRARRS
jgi:hypothetical protein